MCANIGFLCIHCSIILKILTIASMFVSSYIEVSLATKVLDLILLERRSFFSVVLYTWRKEETSIIICE